MRRSPRPGSAASSHKQAPDFSSDNSSSSHSVTSGDSNGPRSAGPELEQPEGRRARGSSCAEPALSPEASGGAPRAGSSRPKPAPRSHNGQTACGAATVRGGASEPAGSPAGLEEQLSFLPALDLRQEMPTPRVSKSFLSFLFQVLSVLLSVAGDVLVSVYREVCSIRFLFTTASLLSVFLAVTPAWPLTVLLRPQPPPQPPWFPPCPLIPEDALLSLQHSGGVSCTWSPLWRIQYHQRVHSQGQQLQRLQAELNKLHKEVSSVRAAHSERVAKLVFQRLNEDFVRKPDYALSSVGASIDLEKTSSDYEDTNTAYFWNRLSFWNYARPPSVILEPDVFPGNCWAFEGDKGQVVIRLPGHVQLSDITLQHPPPTVAHTGGASSAPRDFAVFGLQVDDETEVLLGKFIFDVQKSEIQTFHLQNDPPSAFPKVKIQILSNWGHPRFTCLYRVRAHGVRISEWAEDNATGVTGGPH
ncbi:sperm-associated antigen 4 protein isoform X2 [Peromyscus californicus insignis]|uniref:sperm-associated antigen 4 protein isoform X2 n=1 Tax=Peromyscus californicus insignis TaxID=564181 RepID=UPI0022A79841|nr:sperm-associated antigen 4 protein isoform X2 [Peromyscus californicus insignis]